MAQPTTPSEDEVQLIKQANQAHHRLADMLVKEGLSPYQFIPDKVKLTYPIPAYSAAVELVLSTADCKTPDPKLQPPKKPSSKHRS